MCIEWQTTEDTIVGAAVKFMSVPRLHKVTGVLKTCSENYAVPSGRRLSYLCTLHISSVQMFTKFLMCFREDLKTFS